MAVSLPEGRRLAAVECFVGARGRVRLIAMVPFTALRG